MVQPGGYTVHMQWLRATIAEAHGARGNQREQLMDACSARIAEELAGLDAQPEEEGRARKAADAVLAQRQFRGIEAQPSLWHLLLARVLAWLDRVLFSAAQATARRPWIGLVVEWTCLLGALAGTLAFLLQALRRERVPKQVPWRERSDGKSPAGGDWLAAANAAAMRGAWREAIHALYWATVAHMARNGRWRGYDARTPREYLRLLEPESAERRELSLLTLQLERFWYAGMQAGEREYEKARSAAARLGVLNAEALR